MPQYHDFEQYSDQWDKMHLGIPTSSGFSNIISPNMKPSDSWRPYAHHLIAERCLQRTVDTYTSPAMELGKMMEQDAVFFYESLRNVQTQKIGMVLTDDGKVGCSPDRLIGDDGLLEIKCPKPQQQIDYLLTGKLNKAYWPQLQGQLYVTEREWVDIFSFHPELPPSIIRVTRDKEFIACLEKQLFNFNNYIEQVMDKIHTMQNIQKS